MRVEITGLVREVLVACSADTLVSTTRQRVQVTLEGFAGDKHSGYTRRADARTPHFPRGTVIRNSRQVSIVSLEELALIAASLDLPELLPSWLGANLACSGIPDLSLLPPGTRLFFPDDTVLVVEGENEPCIGPACGPAFRGQPAICAGWLPGSSGREASRATTRCARACPLPPGTSCRANGARSRHDGTLAWDSVVAQRDRDGGGRGGRRCARLGRAGVAGRSGAGRPGADHREGAAPPA